MENRLCNKPLHLSVDRFSLQEQYRTRPIEHMDLSKLVFEPKMLAALRNAGSPCLDCRIKKIELYDSQMDMQIRGAMRCGLGKNPVCPDKQVEIRANTWTVSGLGADARRLSPGELKAMYQQNFNNTEYPVGSGKSFRVMPLDDDRAPPPAWVPPRSKDLPATVGVEVW